MPLDILLPLGAVLLVALTAFSVSAAIGLVMAGLGLDELDDRPLVQPATMGRRPRG